MNFINVIKPTHVCNLSCTYCYNEDIRKPIMTEETLSRVIFETFSYTNHLGCFSGVEFIWHGGEPLIPGIKFYENVLRLQEKYSNGISYINSIQTNGTLLTNKWVNFLSNNDFLVSLSIDGPKELHDANRIDKKGNGSFDRVMSGIRKLNQANQRFGSVLVINKQNKAHVENIYDFMVSEKIAFNVIPMTKSGSAVCSYEDLGLEADEYYEPWIKLYDLWFDAEDDRYTYISDFVRKTQAIMAGRAADCIGMSQCGNANCSTDPLGDIYPCASLSGHPNLIYGNINKSSLLEIMNSNVAKEYRTRKPTKYCNACKWQHVCHGGCQARSYKFFSGNYHERDYYCPSLYKIYEHIEKKLATKGIKARAPYPNHMDDGLGGTPAYIKSYISNKHHPIEITLL
ncbi:Anaerobic sulfatase-maturating enzyme [Photorhabdus australis subsp. thailandensis]|uniref:Anaerobic sulfatase-maturating enzyme n=1 Tax=Photorhabdus australis subsp. thailandensis TaxID=2805096 RepID=A0A1C0U7F5_9GAMM|nr:dynobactin maturation radical SAM/SPASM protein DynA [Photorhabdus australis]OCQ53858.1 Anaerobic sulfatase-maturating enzyme [Photorhabdus australis subsp. thailandensis]